MKNDLEFDDHGNIRGKIDIGAEICRPTFPMGAMYRVARLRDKDQPNKSEEMGICTVSSQEESPDVKICAAIPLPRVR